MAKRVYLANPYGFSAHAHELLLKQLQGILEGIGLEVWEPFDRNNQLAKEKKPGWAYEVGQKDVRDVRECDAIFAVINGTPPDEGVMVELGIAIALHKPIFLFRDDFRRCADSDDYPLNLMIFTGLPQVGWDDFYYRAVEEISKPTRPLVRWARGELKWPPSV